MKPTKLFYPSAKGLGTYHWFPFPYLYLAPYYDAEIIDARVDPGWRDRLRNCKCLGVTAMTGSDIDNVMETIAIARKNGTEEIIWGGPHATAVPDECLAFADTVVVGPGIDGLFDSFPFPDLDRLEIEKYRSKNNIASMFTAQGCPFHCTFCTTGDKTYSQRTMTQVCRELLQLIEVYRFQNIFIQDGTFFVDKARVLEIADMLKSLGVSWKAKARANSLLSYYNEDLEKLRDSGLKSIFFGLESGSRATLNRMKKGTKTEDAEESARICHIFGWEFYVSIMFATPGETVDDLLLTINHVKRLKDINPNIVVQNCLYIPLPGTPMYQDLLNTGWQPPKYDEWRHRDISSDFERRTDITWVTQEYKYIYNNEYAGYRHLFEKEQTGDYTSPLRGGR